MQKQGSFHRNRSRDITTIIDMRVTMATEQAMIMHMHPDYALKRESSSLL
jgi:hypothetical protein